YIVRVAEVVGVARIEALLIEIADVREEPHVDLALFAVEQLEAGVRHVRRRVLLRLRRDRALGTDLPREEFGAAAVRDPDAMVVVTPSSAEQTRRRAGRPRKDHARGRVRRAIGARSRLRSTGDPLSRDLLRARDGGIEGRHQE